MTKTESEVIEKLNNRISQMSCDIANLRDDYKKHIDKIQKQAELTPVNLERDILSSVQTSINKAIGECLGGYNSPLLKLVHEVVNSHSVQLKSIIDETFASVIKTEDFKKSILDAFLHKVARTIISNNDDLFDKVSNDLKQDQTFKAKMTLAVANVVEECLNSKSR